jgi:Na+/proline symporter
MFSHVSGITLLGVPSEIYANGTQYWMFIIPAVTVSSRVEKSS